ncbi:MAG: polysaccharide biosynthesis/export family protein, partial [candidate division WOR-3 bacterium]
MILLPWLTAIVLAPGDMIRVYLWPDTMISGQYRVLEDGSCYLPILGKVTAGGKEAEALRAELEKAYETYYNNPQLTLEPLFRVYVTGEVFGP